MPNSANAERRAAPARTAQGAGSKGAGTNGAGNGAELRRPLGITIVGGLIVSQLLTLYTTPVVYLYLAGLRERVLARVGRWRSARVPSPVAAE